jgi:DNA mismatch endonuclease (patch repair protein)
MRKVRRRDTGAEMCLRRALWKVGLRYRTNLPVAGATPDVVFTRAKVAVFVDGCFWHGCPTHYVAPVNNAEFWRKRLTQNQTRDARDTLRLEAAGWTVLRLWECEVLRRTEDAVARVRAEVS